MARDIITGLDIGSATVRVAVCERVKDNRVPRVLALIKKPSRGLRRGYIVNVEEAAVVAGEAIREAERVAKVKIKDIVLAISGLSLESKIVDGAIAISRPDGEVGLGDVNRVLTVAEAALPDMVNRHILHSFPLAFKLDGVRLHARPEGLRGAKLEVRALVITCLAQHLQDFIQVAEKGGAEVAEVVAAPLAASVVCLNKVEKNSGAVLVNIGSQTTSLIAFDDGWPVLVQVIPKGSNDITNDIALGLRISLDEAERMKLLERNEAPTTRRKLDVIIEARASEIFEYVEGLLKKANKSGLFPGGVLLGGGGANLFNLEAWAAEYLNLPARLVTNALQANSRNQIKDPAWATSFGLCLFREEGEPVESLSRQFSRGLAKKILGWLKQLLP